MFIETPRFPDDISLGVSGGPEFKTDIALNPGGFSVANATRDLPVHKVDAAHGVRTLAQFNLLKSLFMNVRGRWGGFRYKDWADFQFDFDSGVLVFVSPGVYQLTKLYVYGASVFSRPLKKPVAGTIAVQRNSTPVAAGALAGNYAIDTTTGLVTFVPDASIQSSGLATGTATVVTLASSIGSASELTLVGFGGADADLVNGLTFEILAYNASTFQYTLAVDTTGKDIGSSGVSYGQHFPESFESLTAAGEFDLAMKFDTDFMQSSMDYSKKLHTWSQIPLVEWKNPS